MGGGVWCVWVCLGLEMYYYPYHFRLSDYDELKKKTPRRVAAAIKAVRRIEDKNYQPLFDGNKMSDTEVEKKAHDRVDYYIKLGRERLVADRKNEAKQWCLVRRVRRRVPKLIRKEFDLKWQSKTLPGRPEYAADLLNRLIRAYYLEEGLFKGVKI